MTPEMTTKIDPNTLAKEGKRAFESGNYQAAIQAFTDAAANYAKRGDATNSAEMKNNLSVSLLQARQAQKALDATLGTDDVFAKAGDIQRQAMAIGNQAAALEALKRWDEALAAYERSADLFAQAGEGDLQSVVLKSAAAIKLRHGKITDGMISMLGSLESVKKPTLIQRFLKTLLRLIP